MPADPKVTLQIILPFLLNQQTYSSVSFRNLPNKCTGALVYSQHIAMADSNSLMITMKHELIAHTTMSCMSITLNLFAPPHSPRLTPLTPFNPPPNSPICQFAANGDIIGYLIIQLAKEKCNRTAVNPAIELASPLKHSLRQGS